MHLHTLLLRFCFTLISLLLAQLSHAQIQRSIVNPSFEQPFTGTRAAGLNAFFTNPANWISVDQNEIVGWNTTHPSQTNGCPAGGGIVPAYTCNPIELWANGFSGVTPAQGIVLAELNAYVASKLQQNVCFTTGEVFTFNFAHRGRQGADRAQFQVGASLSVILDVTTNTSGTGTINAGGGAVSTSAVSIAGGWTRYSGTYTYTGASGIQPIGFSAVSSVGGAGVGNLLDDINIFFKPYIEFTTAISSSVEGGAAAPPKLKITGIVPAGGLAVSLNVSGTSVFGTDYNYSGATTLTGVSGTATTLSFTIPAGNYDDAQANNVFTLPLNVIDNTIIENNRSVILTMPSNSNANAFVVGATSTCGGAANTQITHTIIDNDIDLKTTKTVTPITTVAYSAPLTYAVTFENVTPAAVLTLAPLTAHDATSVLIADAVPAGMSFTSWTCVATGTTCPAASGAGAINTNANLPVGAKLSYTINATAPATGTCGSSIVNTSTIATTATGPAAAALTEGTSVAGTPAYVMQPNTASTTSTYPTCANLALTKDNSRATVLSGDLTTYVVKLTNNGPDAANGTLLQDPAVTGLNVTAVSCTYTNGAVGPASPTVAQLQAGFAITTLPNTGTASCSVTAQVL